MKDEKDIFDLSNTGDLSETCRKELRMVRSHNDTKKLLALFDIKSQLSIDEIIVALYRQHAITKSRAWVSSALYNAGKKGFVENVRAGVYKKLLEEPNK